MFRQISMIIATAALALPMTSQASITCKAIYELTENSTINRTIEELAIVPTKFGLIDASAKIKNTFFSIQGYEQGNEFRVFIVEGTPPKDGAGIVMNATFNENNLLRLSYVKGMEVYKVVCNRQK